METEYNRIVGGFLSKTLPKSAWTHTAHLAVSVHYCRTFPLEIALRDMRTAIRAYNESVGTANTDASGYHETLTRFWLETTALFLQQSSSKSAPEQWNGLLQTRAATSGYPLIFYSRELLFSVSARRQWIPPDVLPVTAP